MTGVVVAVRDAVDYALRLLGSNLLVVVDDITEVVTAAVVSFAHAHRVVGEVDIAVVAEEFRHLGGGLSWEVSVWEGKI